MSEQASTIAREAKGVQQSLKEALKTRDAWDKEVDFQRKNLRRHYLRLLLVYPYAKESKDAETHLWMQTSYTCISSYKQRIAALDSTVNAPSRNQPKQQPRQGGHGPVEYRKLLQRFRQFLAEEEKFWSQLVVRFRRSFNLDEAHHALVTLGILPNRPEGSTDAIEEHSSAALNGRNHFQFPLNDSGVSLAPKTPAERESRLAILSKALVCLGDIARYRELYHEGGGRPKAGHEESMPLKRTGRKRGGAPGTEVISRPRNYDKAQNCYEQARLLVPYEGNPSHQLAILASYKKDAFGSLVHYYRALCVRQPYDTAAENLGTVLTKTLEQWRARKRSEKGSLKDTDKGASLPLTPRLRVEAFKEKAVVLHALWRLGVEKMDSISLEHAEGLRDDFFSLVSERGLPSDLISKAIILSQGALWKHRMIREPTGAHKEDDSTTIESRILTHVLALHETLLQVGIAQLAEAPPEENDLAQRITAIFRRTLPALRIASKWLRANFKYLSQSHNPEISSRVIEASVGSNPRKRKEAYTIDHATRMSEFWRTYSQFSADLRSLFPPERLPRLDTTLEEDVDTRGFLPLRNVTVEASGSRGKAIRSTDVSGDTDNANLTTEGQVHPNEEQLMRIADLLDDARILVELAELENLPIVFSRNQFMMESSPNASSSLLDEDQPVSRPKLSTLKTECFDPYIWKGTEDEDEAEITSRTDDDPVSDAFRQVLDAEPEDDDEDEIVWNPRPTLSPVSPSKPLVLTSSPPHPGTSTYVKPTISPIGTSPRSPTHQSPFASPAVLASPTTAEDLLNNVMGVPRTLVGGDIYRPQHYSDSSVSHPQLLFGSGSPNPLGHSIWSPSLDDQSLKFVGAGHSYHSPPQHSSTLSQNFSQSKWYSQSSSSHISSAPQSASLAQPLHTIGGGHRATNSSSSISLAQLFASQQQGPHTPFRYPSTSQQPLAQPVGASQFQPPFTDSVINTNLGTEMHYGPGAIGDFRSSYLDHNHSPGVGQALPPPALSQIWGANVG